MQEAGDHEHHADHAPQTTLFTLERTIAQRREAMQQPSGEGLVAECTAFRIIQLVRGGCSLIFEVKVLLWVSLATLVSSLPSMLWLWGVGKEGPATHQDFIKQDSRASLSPLKM